MKILIADKLDVSAIDDLERLGATITNQPDLTAEEIPNVIADNEILIVRSTKVTADTINNGASLSLIIRAGAGINTIDLKTASQRGIHVANCPGKNSDAVAELAIGLLIAADRRIAAATIDLQAGKWNKKEYGKANGLKGRTLGVIGLGNIGKAVIRKAKGLDMDIAAWSRSLTPEKADELGVTYCENPLNVAKIADAISLHVAVTPETKHLVNETFLATMKDGAILVNAARGEIVDTVALKAAIKTKGLRVATDVFENEPKGGVAEFTDLELAKMATCTPHIGASTNQSTEAIAADVVKIVTAYKTTGAPINVVNLREKTVAEYNLVIRHFNRAGVLAKVLDELRNQEINIEEMQNSIFEGGEAATCTLKLDSKPKEELIELLNNSSDIIKVSLN